MQTDKKLEAFAKIMQSFFELANLAEDPQACALFSKPWPFLWYAFIVASSTGAPIENATQDA